MKPVELDETSMRGGYDVSYTHPKPGDISEWRATYAISPINGDKKYSRAFYDCTGFVASENFISSDFLYNNDTNTLQTYRAPQHKQVASGNPFRASEFFDIF